MRGSIAEVCRGTGINRQQFNKYLAGRMLPGSINMRKICSFLGASEAELIGAGAPAPLALRPSGGSAFLSAEQVNDYWDLLTNPVSRPQSMPVTSVPGSMPNGFYEFYLPFHGACHMLLRWLLQVSAGVKGQVFSCRTAVSDTDGQGWSEARFRYRGIVLPGVQDVCLVGMGDMPLHQPSVISVSLIQQEGRRHFPARALTRRASGPLATLAALSYRGPALHCREALARTGVVSMFDPGLDPVVARMMSAAPEGGWNWMRSALPQTLAEVAMPAA